MVIAVAKYHHIAIRAYCINIRPTVILQYDNACNRLNRRVVLHQLANCTKSVPHSTFREITHYMPSSPPQATIGLLSVGKKYM